MVTNKLILKKNDKTEFNLILKQNMNPQKTKVTIQWMNRIVGHVKVLPATRTNHRKPRLKIIRYGENVKSVIIPYRYSELEMMDSISVIFHDLRDTKELILFRNQDKDSPILYHIISCPLYN